jgi:hypothetical protein
MNKLSLLSLLAIAGSLPAQAQNKTFSESKPSLTSQWFVEGGLRGGLWNINDWPTGYRGNSYHSSFTPYFSVGKIVNNRWWHSAQLNYIGGFSGSGGGVRAWSPRYGSSYIPLKHDIGVDVAYQLGYVLNANSPSKFKFIMGAELSANYRNGLVSLGGEYGKGSSLELGLGLTPKVVYNINKRVFLSATLPINVATFKAANMKQYNDNGQRIGSYSGTEFNMQSPNIGLQLGIGIRF